MEPQLFSCGLSPSLFVKRFPRRLQWSRNFSVADCKIQARGYSLFRSFNGAATFQLRIAANNPTADEPITSASMEPQLFSCGLLNAIFNSIVMCVLQWSRNFSVADWVPSGVTTSKSCALQWSRNFSVADCIVRPCW